MMRRGRCVRWFWPLVSPLPRQPGQSAPHKPLSEARRKCQTKTPTAGARRRAPRRRRPGSQPVAFRLRRWWTRLGCAGRPAGCRRWSRIFGQTARRNGVARLPINLASALQLAGVNPLDIAAATVQVQQGLAVLLQAKVLWVPR